MEQFDWLTLDEDEKIVWTGNPKLQRLLNFTFTDYVLTNRALYRKSGIFSRNVQKIDLDKVQNIYFNQGITGKIFGYGNVEMSTAGGSGVEMRFNGVDQPKEVQETINRQSKNKNKPEEDGKDVMHKILDELRHIRKAIEDQEL